MVESKYQYDKFGPGAAEQQAGSFSVTCLSTHNFTDTRQKADGIEDDPSPQPASRDITSGTDVLSHSAKLRLKCIICQP